MEAVRRRMAGEASDEDMESALGGMNRPAARRSAAKPTTSASSEATSRSRGAAPDTYGVPSLTPNAGEKAKSDLSVNERLENTARRVARSFPGSSPMASLDAVVGPTAGSLARSTGKFLGGLGGSKAAVSAAAPRTASIMESPVAARLAATRAEKQKAGLARAQERSQSIRSAEEDVMAGEGGRYAKGGKVSSASSRADGIATKGKTRGRMC